MKDTGGAVVNIGAYLGKGYPGVRSDHNKSLLVLLPVYNRWMKYHGGVIVNIIVDIWNAKPNARFVELGLNLNDLRISDVLLVPQ